MLVRSARLEVTGMPREMTAWMIAALPAAL